MKIKIVADSSANLEKLTGMDYASVPLKIMTDEKEYTDEAGLDVSAMLTELSEYKGKSSTACPGIGDFMEAFGDADLILCAPLTSKISGCYNSAQAAAGAYMEEHPEAKVVVLDTLTTGAELELIVEKMAELAGAGMKAEEIENEMKEYMKKSHLAFSLESLENFAKNGRVSPAVAKLTEFLNIRVVGQASAVGDLEPLNKCRGEGKAIKQIWQNMKDAGYQGGKIRIRHTENPGAAEALKKMILEEYPACDLKVGVNYGLCAYYTERGGILVGYEA